jgi:hypothetical protein
MLKYLFWGNGGTDQSLAPGAETLSYCSVHMLCFNCILNMEIIEGMLGVVHIFCEHEPDFIHACIQHPTLQPKIW